MIVDLRDDRVGDHFDAQPAQLLFRFFRQIGRIGRQNALLPFDHDHACARRFDAPKIADHRVPGNLRQRAGQLGAGRSGANDHECEPRLLPLGIDLPFRRFEGQENSPANLQRVFHALQPRRMRFPFGMIEIGVRRAGGDDQIVVRHFTVDELHDLLLHVDRRSLGEQDRGVFLMRHHRADGVGDVTRVQRRGGHLVEQRLEEVIVPAIEHGDAHRRSPQRLGRVQTPEPSAQDDDAR